MLKNRGERIKRRMCGLWTPLSPRTLSESEAGQGGKSGSRCRLGASVTPTPDETASMTLRQSKLEMRGGGARENGSPGKERAESVDEGARRAGNTRPRAEYEQVCMERVQRANLTICAVSRDPAITELWLDGGRGGGRGCWKACGAAATKVSACTVYIQQTVCCR